jgi:2-phosphoglycerate kinase
VTDRRHRRPLPLGGEDGLPFSKGLLARSLAATGISTDRAYELALAAEADIAQSGLESISFERLGELAREKLGEEDGATTMRRLHRFQDLYDLDLPVILLVGGATGTGKSTVATDVAYRLGITRVTSTDFVRQTMRAFFSREFMPAIHYSSFEAGRAIADADAEGSEAVLDGFLEQTRDVLVGVQAAIERALEEGWSMVLEGVHLVPGMLPREIHGALVVQCVLAINDAEAHASHFWIRDSDSEGVRPYEKYLDAFDDIRLVQAYIQGRARKNEVPVIENGNIEEAIGEVMELVLSAAEPLEVKS